MSETARTGFARRMMAQRLMSDARDDPFSDSRFFSGRIRPSMQDMAEPTRFSDMAMPAYATGATASLFAPGAGVTDIMGFAPDPAQPGEFLPSFGQNITQGNFLDAGLQALGGAGDVVMAGGALLPPALPAATAVSAALKAPRAARVAGAASEANTLVDDLPVADLEDFVGKKIFPIVADLTAAGKQFEGIDASKLDVPVDLQGGPEFPNLQGSRDANVVWAVQGKGVGTKKLSKDADYGLVVAMNPDSHRSNATFVNAVLGNTLAYVRDGRIAADNVAELDNFIRTGTDQSQLQDLKNWPGFASPEAGDFIKSLNFEARKRISDVVGSSRGQALGAPNIDKIIRATGEANLLGLNSRDSILLVEIDKGSDLVRLGQGGTMGHASYDFGIQGRPVARIPAVSAKNMFPDFYAQAEAQGKQNVRRAFDLALPVQEITPEMAKNVARLATQTIASPRQAQLTGDLLVGNWKSSKVAKNQGGVSPAEFVQALSASDASSTLTMMDIPDVSKKIRGGNFDLYQLGDGQVFFGLEKGYNYDDVYGINNNPTFVRAEGGPELGSDEVALVSVINNEVGAKGVGKATVLKAIEEGATALDAFAVPSDRFPDGFLPDFYASFGFEEVGRIDFDPSFYSQTELADLEDYWRSTGWNEDAGPPKIVIMKWTGDDGLRTNATKRFVSEGRFYAGEPATGVFAGAESLVRASDGPNLEAAPGQRGSSVSAGNPGGAGAGTRPLAPDQLAAVARELLTLPDEAVANLGVDPGLLQGVRQDLGIFR